MQKRITTVITLLILLLLVVTPFIVGSYTFADALRGFEIMQQYKEGAAFNTLNYPGISNAIYTYEIAWWAPGQWIIPYVISLVTGIASLQQLQAIMIALGLIAAFVGYNRLFQLLKIDPLIRITSLLLMVCSPLFYWQSLMYHGGDLLTIAYFPWFATYLITRNKIFCFREALFFFILGVAGVYLKTSFLLFVAGGGLFLFFRERQTFLERLKRNWHFGFAALGVLIFAKFLLLNGETPGSAMDQEGWFGVPNDITGDLLYSFSSPLGIFTTAGIVIQRYAVTHGSDLFVVFVLLTLAFTSFLFVIKELWHHQRYGKLLLFMPYTVFFAFLFFYLDDKAVSYEMRHFAPLAFLFYPSFIGAINKVIGSLSLILISVGFMLLNVTGYQEQLQTLQKMEIVNGVKLNSDEAELSQMIQEWDNNQSNSLFLMESYWAPSYHVRKNEKLVITGEELSVVSGMELDKPDRLKEEKELTELIEGYNEVLIVGYNHNSTDLFNFASTAHIISEGELGRYYWKRIKP